MKTGIVTYAFGVPSTTPPNRLLAEITCKAAEHHIAPVYTQQDIKLPDHVDVSYVEEQPGSPPPTLRIARRAMLWAREKQLTHLVVVAAGPHMWRALRDTRRAAIEAGLEIDIRQSSEVNAIPEESWFSEESVQQRVRTPKDWNGRERLLHLMPFWVYKRVVS